MQPTIRPLCEEETTAASALIQTIFDRFEAPDYIPQGVETFHRFTTPEALAERLRQGTMQLWGAYFDDRLSGVLASRDQTHISLLFVDAACHRQGIGRRLFSHFRQHLTADPGHRTITVNSSPYAVGFYLRLGFVPTGPERTADGIRFTPMEYPLSFPNR